MFTNALEKNKIERILFNFWWKIFWVFTAETIHGVDIGRKMG